MVDVVNARFVKPLDVELIRNLRCEHIITMEDNVFIGGFGSMVNGELIRQEKACKVKNFAYRDEFIPQGAISQLQSEYGVSCQKIEGYLMDILA